MTKSRDGILSEGLGAGLGGIGAAVGTALGGPILGGIGALAGQAVGKAASLVDPSSDSPKFANSGSLPDATKDCPVAQSHSDIKNWRSQQGLQREP